MALVALVALIVIGPKELPQAMRSASKWIRKGRSLAREFQSGVDDMVREADLEDARKAVQNAKNFDAEKALEQTIDPTGGLRDEAKDLAQTARDEDADPPAEAEEPEPKIESAEDHMAARAQEKTGQAGTIEPPVTAAPAEDNAEAMAEADASKSA